VILLAARASCMDPARFVAMAAIAAAMPPGVELLFVGEPEPVRRARFAVTRRDRSPAAVALVEAPRMKGAVLSGDRGA
jgi:hypothetical protein